MTEGAIKGIFILSDSTITIKGQYKMFSESVQTYIDKGKMSNDAIYIKELEDKPKIFLLQRKRI